MSARAVMSPVGRLKNPRVTKSFEQEGTTGGLWSQLLLRAGHCQLLTRLLGTAVHQDYAVTAPPSFSCFQRCPFHFIPKLSKQRGGCVHPFVIAALLTKLPNIPGELLGEVSHHVVWLGCFCSSMLPLRAFVKPCCAEYGAAAGWPLPNLAALPRAGLNPPKHCHLCTLIGLYTVALPPLLLMVATSGLFLKAGFRREGIPENLASPLFP